MTLFIRRIALLALISLLSAPDAYCINEITLDTADIKRPSFLKRVGHTISDFVKEFNNVDTNFVEPQHFKFQVMLQNTNTFDRYTLKAGDDELKLAPRVHSRIGPYVGYSLVFLGYALQLNHFYLGNNKKTFDLSLYTALGGVDVFYRNNTDMRVRYLRSNTGEYEYSALKDIDFDGAEVSSTGFDIYYIFNHRKHSLPAAYNQSTCQKRSAGSAIAGFGYSHHKLSMDWDAFDKMANEYVADYVNPFSVDERISNVEYTRYNLYGGYSYNWVFAKNWLLGASVTAAIGFNHTKGDVVRFSMRWKNFSNHNFYVDGTGRIGVVWNNTRIFAGASAQIHSYTYSKDRYSLNNLFGNVITYVGFNFGKKKKYRAPDNFFEF